MLENIHDIAPGASLAFATGDSDELAFAKNIQALASTAGMRTSSSTTSAYADEPMFQDGLIAQAVNTVTAQGVTYFSAAGNDGPTTAISRHSAPPAGTITGHRHRHVHELQPQRRHERSSCRSRPTVANAQITFEYDQPYQTQEPAGSPGTVTSNVNIYVLDAAPALSWSAPRANNNNVAIQEPWQIVTIPNAGQLRRRDPGRLRAEPGPRRVRRASTTRTSTLTRQPAVRQRGRHVLIPPRSGTTRPSTRSASARPRGGRRLPTSARTRWPTSPSARRARRSTSSTSTARRCRARDWS